jgi:hypothetical protein
VVWGLRSPDDWVVARHLLMKGEEWELGQVKQTGPLRVGQVWSRDSVCRAVSPAWVRSRDRSGPRTVCGQGCVMESVSYGL